MGNKFIKIDRDIFNSDERNLFNYIGTEGFALYHYLLMMQGNKSFCQVSIKMIQNALSFDYDNRPQIEYHRNKIHKISTLKDKKTIIKYLNLLQLNKCIEVREDIPAGINDFMIIKCNELKVIKNEIDNKVDDNVKEQEKYNGFLAFPEELFVDYIYKIGHIGFALLSLLGKLHNINFGGIGCEGFANPSEEYISKVIKKDTDTIRAYLYLLHDLKLIKIEQQNPIEGENYDKYGRLETIYLSNHYIVKYKLPQNKYYIDITKKRKNAG